MKSIDFLAAVLVVIGALNWGLVGMFGHDLVAGLFGDAAVLTKLIYISMGVAGVFQALQWKAIQGRWTGRRLPVRA